ncbi:MAG TPA: 5-oxoprolinase subunit PxpA [Candidatus Ignatzschineria merdigallinarum]|uniref:5-oxoprolinase subunit PxpA n=1 Tax=Candidatus Ignatzschineria merdigallinarum TaxID=2838621 RepID=A0A9D1Q5P7_9GAMM|nr:5-oxoprolinase subunit PxpA [Candidatus Ignatzschineria merdigallinarum]
MKKSRVDLNSDLGEGFGIWRAGDGQDAEILQLISSANIATGFHAGDPMIMDETVRLAKERKVGIGAHPGYRDLVGFGRRKLNATKDELINDIVYQVGALEAIARRYDLPIQHVKPHGALYMTIADDADLSEVLVKSVQKIFPEAYIFCMDVSKTYEIAKSLGQPVIREFYADRDYDDSGSLVFTRGMGRLDPVAITDKVVRACLDGKVKTVTGQWQKIEFESICIHSDTPGVVELLKAIHAGLEAENIDISNQFVLP